MNRKLIALLLANLFVAPAAFAQDAGVQLGDMRLKGYIGIGGLWTDEDATDKAKLNEYQDLSDGGFVNFGLTGRGDRYWFNGYGENIFRDDMYVDFRGGMYDAFKYRLYSNWLTHNFGNDLRTPYGNVGGTDLRTTFPRYDTGTWNSFDLGYDRKDTGVSLEWAPNSPWYAKLDFNQVTFDGSKLYAASNGTSPGNGFVDLPGPVDYRTNNLNLEGGYQSRDLIGTVSVLWSSFDNKQSSDSGYFFTWTNPYFSNGIDRTYMPPSNDFFKIAANGALRNLPMNSTLAARFTWSKTDSSADLAQRMLHYTTPTGTPPSLYEPITANTSVFNGKEENTTFSLSWTALPMAGLDTKVYYNYFDRKNKSDEVDFNTSALNCTNWDFPAITKPSVPCEAEKFSYTKHNFGINAYYKSTLR